MQKKIIRTIVSPRAIGIFFEPLPPSPRNQKTIEKFWDKITYGLNNGHISDECYLMETVALLKLLNYKCTRHFIFIDIT